MKFAIVADTHDNVANFTKVIEYLNKENIELLLHCGDICTEETIRAAEEKLNGEIKFVRGNGDYNLHDIPDSLELNIDGNIRTAMIHYPDLAKKLAESGKYDLVFYGHTHRPWEEKVGNCRLINPGEVAGQRFKPTFAVYDTQAGKLELKILETL